MRRLVINFLLFQAGWFACVIGAAKGLPLLGPATVAVAVMIHLFLAHQPQSESLLLVFAALLGAVFDSLLAQSGNLNYVNGMLWPGTAPYWIVSMWVLFATTLNVSMKWLRGRYGVAALLGLIGGPLSYLGGAELGGLMFVDLTASLIMLAVGWALIMPALVWVAKQLDGMSRPDREPVHA